jgi:glyoxylase-like metal-dependent hydrolase (beta-lactamase superfamily II)
MMLRVTALIVALLTTPVHGADYAPITKPLSVQQVPGKAVYYSIGDTNIPSKSNEGNTSNGGFVVTDDGVVVFDALGTPSLGWALLQQIRLVTDKPVRYVVVSHYHADHIYGLQAFKDHTAALVVAQERAAEYRENDETADERADARLRQRRGALSPWVDEHTRVIAPDLTFAERATVNLGGKRFVLLYAGPAHSASDMMMMVEPDGVLFAGDIVQNGRIPHMNSDDVSTDRWLQALRQVESLKPSFIVPGHGQPSTEAARAINFTAGYIAYVRKTMKAAVDAWTDFDTAYAGADWTAYDKLPAFAANNRGNAYRVFLELEGANFGDGKKP